MTESQIRIANELKAYAAELQSANSNPAVVVALTPDNAANQFVLDNPNAFLAAVIFDYQITAERAWAGPYLLSQRIGHFDMNRLANADLNELSEAFLQSPALHRFNQNMAKFMINMAKHLIREYDGDASNIWNDNPTANNLTYRFLAFDGVGQKKADMAVNILMRDFGVKIRRSAGTNVAFDVHIDRVFRRTGLVSEGTNQAVQAATRELAPEDPGILDLPVWYIGREWCRPQEPNCSQCRLSRVCPRLI